MKAQSILTINKAGLHRYVSPNSVRDDLGNIYYCSYDSINETLIVTSITKELILRWSYNYNINSGFHDTNIFYSDGKIYIVASNYFLILDPNGNVLGIKKQNGSSASSLMHNDDLLLAGQNNNGSAIISRFTPAFTKVFSKQIAFTNRVQVSIQQIKQFGNRIFFGGTSGDISQEKFYWMFGALDLNGSLIYCKEYEIDNQERYSQNNLTTIDSVAPDLILAAGFTGNQDPKNLVTPHFIDGLLVKFNPTDGSVLDYLLLSPQKEEDWMVLWGMKYQSNKIRICGEHSINRGFTSGLLFGEVDLDFKKYHFQFLDANVTNSFLGKFIDFNQVSGSLDGKPMIMTSEGRGFCSSASECFKEGDVITLNKEFHPVVNRYTLTDINDNMVDGTVLRKPIQVNIAAYCGISTCGDSHSLSICKQHYEYDYSSIQSNPVKVSNLTPGIANIIHDRINQKIIIDPIQPGTSLVLMETQINVYLKQLDTFKFIILNDSLPVLDLGPDKVLCNNDSAVLNLGLDSIHWSNGSVGRAITVKAAGMYWGKYSTTCGSVADTIIITTQQVPKLDLGNDLLICGDQPGTLKSNYDNTIWSNGGRGRNILVTMAGKIFGFVSTPCGISYDTVEIYKFDRSSFSAGADQTICDPMTNLPGSLTNPNDKLYSSEIEWKQVDALPRVSFDDIRILNPLVSNLSKDQVHFFELSIRIGNSCILKDTIKVLSKTCFIDSCAFIINKTCLPNGMVALNAINANNQSMVHKTRQVELFWDIKDGPAGRGYSIIGKNPVIVSNHTRFSLTSKIYFWPKGKPHTAEYAEICESRSSDTLTLACTGPCEDFSFILSSCEDDYAVENQLNYPSGFCKSYCENSSDYIIGIFGLDGNMIDPKLYSIKWSTQETGAVSVQKGCINFNITVEIRRGDCVWYGRYRPSCKHYKGFGGDKNGITRSGSGSVDEGTIWQLVHSKQEFAIYNMSGQYIGGNNLQFDQLQPGLYFIETGDGYLRKVSKVFITGN